MKRWFGAVRVQGFVTKGWTEMNICEVLPVTETTPEERNSSRLSISLRPPEALQHCQTISLSNVLLCLTAVDVIVNFYCAFVSIPKSNAASFSPFALSIPKSR